MKTLKKATAFALSLALGLSLTCLLYTSLNRPRAVGIVTLPLLFQGCNRLLCRCFLRKSRC